jgi:hypothetical protein
MLLQEAALLQHPGGGLPIEQYSHNWLRIGGSLAVLAGCCRLLLERASKAGPLSRSDLLSWQELQASGVVQVVLQLPHASASGVVARADMLKTLVGSSSALPGA